MAQPNPPADLAPIFARALALLRDRFGHDGFREGQEAAVRSALAGRSLLVVMPTGSGKSLLYQLPALLADGLTLVVSPLIALMKDQVDDLQEQGIAATFINSSLGLPEQQSRIQGCLRREVSLLYVAPERFQSAAFLSMLRQVKVARMAVDEAHCISEWGHDFRPDYRRLRQFREEMGRPPVTALTATATPRVQKDIVECLGLKADEVDIHVHGFDRPNLSLSVVHAHDRETKTQLVREFLRREQGPGIIYVGTRRAAEEVATEITDIEPHVAVYHAGMEADDRTQAQDTFLTGKARVTVATVAFGMGIDKPDIRFVLHYHYPGSVEEYYQEIGRAGRDGLESRCMLLYSPADRGLREFFIDLSYPTRDQVQSVYETLWRIEENPVMMTYAQIAELCDGDVKDGQVASAVRLLDGAGLTRAMAGEAAAAVGIDRPGAKILPAIRGDIQRRVFESLASFLDLEMPGRYEVALGRLAWAAKLSMEQVRRSLAALAEGNHITYEPPFRGRGIEKLVAKPPPFEKVPIDWKRQGFLRRLEEEKLEAMESYIRNEGCRRGFILRYFGEETDLACRMCDRCQARGSGARPAGGDALARRPEIAIPALVCIRHLRFPLGIGRTVDVLTGSKEKKLLEWRLDKNPAYGRVSAKKDVVKRVIEQMIRDGYMKPEGDFDRPVLGLTPRGKAAAEKAELGEDAGHKPGPQPGTRGKTKVSTPAATHDDARHASAPVGDALSRLVQQMLTGDAAEAKALVEDLRLYHPREVAARLAARFGASDTADRQSRIVWAVGELCGECGLAFLVRCARDKAPNVRRLAASALGKVVAAVRISSTARREALVQAREALAALKADPAPQVRQDAEKALAEFARGAAVRRPEDT